MLVQSIVRRVSRKTLVLVCLADNSGRGRAPRGFSGYSDGMHLPFRESQITRSSPRSGRYLKQDFLTLKKRYILQSRERERVDIEEGVDSISSPSFMTLIETVKYSLYRYACFVLNLASNHPIFKTVETNQIFILFIYKNSTPF